MKNNLNIKAITYRPTEPPKPFYNDIPIWVYILGAVIIFILLILYIFIKCYNRTINNRIISNLSRPAVYPV